MLTTISNKYRLNIPCAFAALLLLSAARTDFYALSPVNHEPSGAAPLA
jgi:hypothetical protein